MNNKTDGDHPARIADELGKDCSRLSLESEPEYLKLFAALIENVSLQDKERIDGTPVGGLGQVKATKKTGKKTKYLDYHCCKFMGITPKKPCGDKLKDNLKEFDPVLKEYNYWRRIGSDLQFTEKRAEIFICCSAHARDRSLKYHLAEFFKYCRDRELNLICLENHQETINKLIDEELTPKQPSRQTNGTIGTKQSPVQPRYQDRDGLCIYWENNIIKIDEGPSDQYLRIPNLSDNLRLDNPASLLDWRCRLMPTIIGRDEELSILRKWLDGPTATCVSSDRSFMYMYGDGGVGKTRLAFQFAEEIQEEGWEAGQPDRDIVGHWHVADKGVLLIIDYPEEREFLVRELIRATIQMPDLKTKLRVMLLSRNKRFLDTITSEAPSLFALSMHLRPLELETDYWALLNALWERLQSITTPTSKKEGRYPVDSALPISQEQLRHWALQQRISLTPLIITSLAIFLYEEHNEHTSFQENLSQFDVIRYLTVREASRIRREIQERKAIYDDWKDIDPEGMLLMKALAAIRGDFDVTDIRLFDAAAKHYALDYRPPGVKQLAKTSFWEDGKLRSLQPDILASDFLAYCMEHWAVDQESEWLIAATGILDDSDIEDARYDQKILDNLSRLSRLTSDAGKTLSQRFLLEATSLSAEYRPRIFHRLARRYFSEPEEVLLIEDTLKKRIDKTNIQYLRARIAFQLSSFMDYSGDFQKSLVYAKQSLDDWRELSKDNFNNFAPKLARCLEFYAIVLGKVGRTIDKLNATLQLAEINDALADWNIDRYGLDAMLAYGKLGDIYKISGNKEKAYAAIKRAAEIAELMDDLPE